MCDRCKELQRQYTAATERAEKAESQRDRMREAIGLAIMYLEDGAPLTALARLKEVGDE